MRKVRAVPVPTPKRRASTPNKSIRLTTSSSTIIDSDEEERQQYTARYSSTSYDPNFHHNSSSQTRLKTQKIPLKSTSNNNSVDIPDTLKKGNYVLLRVGTPSDMMYAILSQNQYNQAMEAQKNFWSHTSNAQQSVPDREIITQVASVLDQIVYKVSTEYATEMNQELLDELEVSICHKNSIMSYKCY
jgi:hypothetical protein